MNALVVKRFRLCCVMLLDNLVARVRAKLKVDSFVFRSDQCAPCGCNGRGGSAVPCRSVVSGRAAQENEICSRTDDR